MISCWPLGSRKKIRPSRTYAPCFTSFLRLIQKTCAWVRLASPALVGVISVEHREVLRLLVLKDARLGVRVGLERAMPVKVVRRDIQHHGNFRAKRLNRLQLKARYLQHDDRFRRGLLDQRDRRGANVSTHRGRRIRRRR